MRNRASSALTTLSALLVALGAAPLAGAAVSYLGLATLSGLDRSGLTGQLEDGVSPAAAIGALSAIAYSGEGNKYYMLPDRGPNFYPYPNGKLVENTQSFINRVHSVEISVAGDAQRGWQIAAQLDATTLLHSATPLTGSAVGNPDRRFFTGNAGGVDTAAPENSMRLDPEGLRVSNAGDRFYISDEYGPFIYEFNARTGQRVRSIRMPSALLLRHPASTAAHEIRRNRTGRVTNRGMEGLAVTPDGNTLVGLMQGPLLQDHALSARDGVTPVGINTRVVTIDLGSCSEGSVVVCPIRQYVYQLSSAAHGSNEILAVNDHQFLIIERDGQAGTAGYKSIALIDLAGATDVSNIARLPRMGLPPKVTPVSKHAFLDLAAALTAAGQPVMEKYEGLAFGPDLPDGRHLLLVCLDNDFRRDVVSSIYVFAIDAADLPGYQPQHFNVVNSTGVPRT